MRVLRCSQLLAVAAGIAAAAATCPFSQMGNSARRASSPANTQNSDWRGQLPGANNDSDPLVVMNHLFHKLYAESGSGMEEEIENDFAVVFQESDYLVLRHKGQEDAQPFTPMYYHDYKMTCHIPLTVFVLLYPLVKYTEVAPLTPESVHNLTQVSQQINIIMNSEVLYNKFPDPSERQRQEGMIHRTNLYMTKVVSEGSVNRSELMDFAYSNNADVNENLNIAAAGQVKGLYNVMEQWRSTLPSDVWKGLKVVVATSHMARRQNLVSQFFARYFGVDMDENERFYTLENVHSLSAAQHAVAVYMTDLPTGDAFFHEHWRMYRDALADGAKKALNKLFPGSATPAPIACPMHQRERRCVGV